MWCNMLLACGLNSHIIFFGRNLSKLNHLYVIPKQKMSTNKAENERIRRCLKDIFSAAVQAVLPKAIIDNTVEMSKRKMYVGRKSFRLKDNVYMVGFGKAVMGMAIALEEKLGDRLKKGIISVPKVSKDAIWSGDKNIPFPKLHDPVIEFHEGSINNQPDERSLETTHEIMDLVESLGEKDTLIVLVSGGGSALLYMPRPLLDPDDKLQLCKALQNAGADITELNIVRRKLSLVKGGGLARIAFPANVITLILSDIVGDPMDLIASGPTVYSPKEPQEVVAILKKYNLFDTLEGDLKKVITSKETFNDKKLLTTPKKYRRSRSRSRSRRRRKGKGKGAGKGKGKGKGKGRKSRDKKRAPSPKEFKHVTNMIIANNRIALRAAQKEAERQKLSAVVLRNDVQGDVHDVSLGYCEVTNLVCLAIDGVLKKVEFFDRVQKVPILSLRAPKVDEIYRCIENLNGRGVLLIGGGEPTVVVKGSGKGGRNQELALHFAMDWLAMIKANPRLAAYDVTMFSGGTDGQDGPTDATGAFGYAAMGPIVQDLYTKVKSKATIEVARAEAREAANAEKAEKGPTPIPCKTEVLSGYITIGPKKVTEEEEKDESELLDTEEEQSEETNVEDDEYQGIHPLILTTMEVERMLPENTLAENDTYNFYSRFYKGIDLVKTGYTGTNVMDLHFIHIQRRKCGCEIKFDKEPKSEDIMDLHDLHIDPETIERYKLMNKRLIFDMYPYTGRHTMMVVPKKDILNLKVVDDNLADPCCNKKRKIPK